MKTVIESDCDKKLEQKLRSYLRTTGRLVPETPEEVEHLLLLMPELTQPQGTYEEAMNILNNGFIDYQLEAPGPLTNEITNLEYGKAAARNAGKLTDDIRSMMDNDREQTLNTPNED